MTTEIDREPERKRKEMKEKKSRHKGRRFHQNEERGTERGTFLPKTELRGLCVCVGVRAEGRRSGRKLREIER